MDDMHAIGDIPKRGWVCKDIFIVRTQRCPDKGIEKYKECLIAARTVLFFRTENDASKAVKRLGQFSSEVVTAAPLKLAV